ncbi:MAG: hypothetical protein LC798_12705 [Chloroflexi bacterium]|nr:hypothetical protein [Chloroflexota bacterium]
MSRGYAGTADPPAALDWVPGGAKASTVLRAAVTSTTLTAPTGQLRIIGLEQGRLAAGVPLNTITFVSGGTAGASLTNCWFCLLGENADGTLAILAKTVNDTSATWAASTARALSFAAAYLPTKEILRPRLGIVVVGTTTPTLIGAAGSSIVNGLSPVQGSVANTGLTDPASLTAVGAQTASAALPYGHIK